MGSSVLLVVVLTQSYTCDETAYTHGHTHDFNGLNCVPQKSYVEVLTSALECDLMWHGIFKEAVTLKSGVEGGPHCSLQYDWSPQ